jgi:hypothetical protein
LEENMKLIGKYKIVFIVDGKVQEKCNDWFIVFKDRKFFKVKLSIFFNWFDFCGKIC